MTPEGMRRVFWSRYEIENYLIHPEAILRFVSRSLGDEEAEKVKKYMEGYLPPVLFEKPFEATAADRAKGKVTIAEVLTSAGVEIGESEYYGVAGAMTPDEIHPDVIEMLDQIEDQLTDKGMVP